MGQDRRHDDGVIDVRHDAPFTLAMLAGMGAFAGLTRFANRETHASRPREDG